MDSLEHSLAIWNGRLYSTRKTPWSSIKALLASLDTSVYWTWIHLACHTSTMDARFTHLSFGTRETICDLWSICRNGLRGVLLFPQGWQSILTASTVLSLESMFNPRYLSVGICLVDSDRTLRMDQRTNLVQRMGSYGSGCLSTDPKRICRVWHLLLCTAMVDSCLLVDCDEYSRAKDLLHL